MFGARFVLFFLNLCDQELLKASATEVRLETRVTGVVGSAKAGYSLIGGAQDKLGTFDAVVIAAPLGLAGIALDVRGEVRSWCRTFTWQQQRSDDCCRGRTYQCIKNSALVSIHHIPLSYYGGP